MVSDNFQRGRLEGLTVYDIDTHLSYLRSDNTKRKIAEYMTEPWASMVHPDKGTASSYPNAGWDKSLGGRKNIHVEDISSADHIRRSLCEELHIDHPIINTFARVDSVTQTERAVDEAQAANEYLVNDILDENPDFYGLISAPWRDPESAVEEIERWSGEKQVLGVYVEAGTEYQKPLGDPTYDVIYRTLEKNNLTPVFHLGVSHHDFRWLRDLEIYAAVHALQAMWSGSLTLTSLLTHGVPEKFNDLNFVLTEFGIAWIPFIMARLNREEGQYKEELPLLEKSPEQYIKDSFYFGTQPIGEFENIEDMRKIINIIGADSLLFASDYPHHDFDTLDTINSIVSHLPKKERIKIFNENFKEALEI